ncbi:glycosyltransferase family 2 protein [Yoonia sediminilitoris]|uniref:Glycosyl transferase family 2 n=1 Tax=Yoonia sediminilitoris TaxID=1286148 RepID=A0A2T6KFY5_9RHOB|nr:glycosyltransferase family A protein [Yoonia sediminilitoris]PUB14237.1 glycosyl transferase family 2 [Yoonia sediminilitoris]RCW95168.1 glycosyl transferase family 2 [Yoonia sediminilitoris]
MKLATIVVPAFNVANTLAETLRSLLVQTYQHFEIIVVDDGSSDETLQIAQSFAENPRLRIVRQPNRGLAGARNTGIAHAKGAYIGFCDADDLWDHHKLEAHVRHLEADPSIGVSYAGSQLMHENGRPIKRAQQPRLQGVDAVHILKRNPVGNGSAPVIRAEVFADIAYRPRYESKRDWYFDETFRQSEDIECWLRIALTTSWRFEGIKGRLTRYRINQGGLSASTDKQLAAWERMVAKLTPIAPDFFAKHAPIARAYQMRYLCRRAVSDLDCDKARIWSDRWFAASKWTFIEEPWKSVETYAAVLALRALGQKTLHGLSALRLGRV